jgi:hypothetical protein
MRITASALGSGSMLWLDVFEQSGARSAIIRLTYCHSKTNEIKQFTKGIVSYSELKAILYRPWLSNMPGGWRWS